MVTVPVLIYRRTVCMTIARVYKIYI